MPPFASVTQSSATHRLRKHLDRGLAHATGTAGRRTRPTFRECAASMVDRSSVKVQNTPAPSPSPVALTSSTFVSESLVGSGIVERERRQIAERARPQLPKPPKLSTLPTSSVTPQQSDESDGAHSMEGAAVSSTWLSLEIAAWLLSRAGLNVWL